MDIELMASARSPRGKGAARSLRREDMVPGILYGPKTEPIPLSIPAKRLERLLRDLGEESKLLRLTLDNDPSQKPRQVLIREIQTHPVRRRFVHVDFYEVPLDHPIVVDVPVELLGESVGVKKGGTLNLIQRMLSVRCLPGEIPEKVQIDVTDLDVGDSLHVNDLKSIVPFELVDDPSMAVIHLETPEAAGTEAGETEGEG
ncbi:MAG: 50S ribosomal protein L25/general stress protein Ctc [Syntrophobacteraceae bacterium]|nr:50S ribosomal protein L25/general stress protein Ctc [Syntrophobacteraceae bacterium]